MTKLEVQIEKELEERKGKLRGPYAKLARYFGGIPGDNSNDFCRDIYYAKYYGRVGGNGCWEQIKNEDLG